MTYQFLTLGYLSEKNLELDDGQYNQMEIKNFLKSYKIILSYLSAHHL